MPQAKAVTLGYKPQVKIAAHVNWQHSPNMIILSKIKIPSKMSHQGFGFRLKTGIKLLL